MAELLGSHSSDPLPTPTSANMPVGDANDDDPRAQARAKARRRRQKIRKENARRAARRAAGESDVSSDLEESDDSDEDPCHVALRLPLAAPAAAPMASPAGNEPNGVASTNIVFDIEGCIAVITLLQHNAPSDFQGSEALHRALEECHRRRGQLTSVFLWVGTQPAPPGLSRPGAPTAPAAFNQLLSRDNLYAMVEGLPQLLVGFTDCTTSSLTTCLLAACDLVVVGPHAQELQLTADREEGYLPLCLQQRLGSSAGKLPPFSSSVDVNRAAQLGLVDEVVSPTTGSLATRRDELRSLLQGNSSYSSTLKMKLRGMRRARGGSLAPGPVSGVGPGPPPGPLPWPADSGAAFAGAAASSAGLEGPSMLLEPPCLDVDACAAHMQRAPAPGAAPPGLDAPLHPKDGKHMDGRPLVDPYMASTALMICNIPCSVTKQQLEEAVGLAGFAGTYEYIYVPEKRRSRKKEPAGRTSNPGYGFISFTDASKALEFEKRFTGYKFQGFSSSKVVEVRPAKAQCSAADPYAVELLGATKPPPGLELLGPPPGTPLDDAQTLPRWGPVPASAGYLLPPAPALPAPEDTLAPRSLHAAPQGPPQLLNAFGRPVAQQQQASLMDLAGPKGLWADPFWAPPGATEADRAMPCKSAASAGDDPVEFGEFHRAPGQPAASLLRPPRHEPGRDAGPPRLDAGLEGFVGAAKPNDPMSKKELFAAMPGAQQGPITALMICNIPCSASQQQLAEAVDSMGFAGKYNFLYLPVKGRPSKSGQSVRRSNLGYGFIDFPNPEDAKKFMKKFTGYQFAGTTSVKRCEVRAAHVQGPAGSDRPPMPFPGLPGLTAFPSSSTLPGALLPP